MCGKVTDRSGTGNHGQAVGARWTAQGKRGGGFEFGPVEHYILAYRTTSR